MSDFETLFDKYSDVPRSILIKIQLLRQGVRYTERAMRAAEQEGAARQTYYIFSHDLTTTPDLNKRKEERSPETIELKDGTMIQTRINVNSPYIIDRIDDKFMLCENDKAIVEVAFLPEPQYYSKQLDDGTPMKKVVQYIPMLFSTVYQHCQFFDMGLECKFCDINVNVARQAKAGRGLLVYKKPEQVAEVLETAIKEPTHRHYLISGGSIVKKVSGMSDVDFYCNYLNKITDRIGRRYHGQVQTVAYPEQDVERIFETGIACIESNIEVWDPKLFKLICPGKDRFVGRDEWIERVIRSVDVFGEGRVCPNFVTGVEMAKPWGFRDVESAVESTLGGFEHLMVHGVVPRMDVWCIESSSFLGQVPRQEPPPVDYYVEIERGYYELMKAYGLPYPVAFCRRCCQIDPMYDWKELYPR